MTTASASAEQPRRRWSAVKPASSMRGDVGVGQVVDVRLAGVEAVDNAVR